LFVKEKNKTSDVISSFNIKQTSLASAAASS
jgi:hypothetical protein